MDEELEVKQPRQGWYCTIQDKVDPRLRGSEGLPWCDVQLPKGILPQEFQGKALDKVIKAVCYLMSIDYEEGLKLIWEKRSDEPEYYELGFDKEGNAVNSD